jgi:hypothetical protein
LTPGVRQRNIADQLTPETGKWLLRSPEFKAWVEILGSDEANKGRVLCCLGNPGVGKTGLAYVLVLILRPLLTQTRCLSFESLDKLKATDNSALAFVYCDHTMQTEQTPTHLIGSLLAQLTNTLPYDSPIMKELLARHTQRRPLDRITTVDYIRRIATYKPRMTIRLGLDGFDELHKDHRSRFLGDLAKLSDIPNIRFLFFGRDTGIRDDMRRLFQHIAFSQITEDLTLADRRLFLQQKLDEHSNSAEIVGTLRTLITEKLGAQNSTYVLIYSYLGGQLTKIPRLDFFSRHFRSAMS